MSAEGLQAPSPEPIVPPPLLAAKPPLLVLHINDSTDDQVLFQTACKKANVPFQWHVVESAERALSYLDSLVGLSRKEAVRWPDLVVLDLVMPGGSGLEVLKHIRATPELRLLPVVVFTGQPTPERREKACELGVNAFHEKPFDFAETVRFVAALYAAWSTARRPAL